MHLELEVHCLLNKHAAVACESRRLSLVSVLSLTLGCCHDHHLEGVIDN